MFRVTGLVHSRIISPDFNLLAIGPFASPYTVAVVSVTTPVLGAA